jgi:hypothetical protein
MIEDLYDSGIINFSPEERDNVLQELLSAGYYETCHGYTFSGCLVTFLFNAQVYRDATLLTDKCFGWLDLLCVDPNTIVST